MKKTLAFLTTLLILAGCAGMFPTDATTNGALMDTPTIIDSITLKPSESVTLLGSNDVEITIKFSIGHVMVDSNITKENQIAEASGNFTPGPTVRIIRWWANNDHSAKIGINATLQGENVLIEWTEGLTKK